MDFQDQAQQFVEDEKQFHLGDLITEKSHPITADLSRIIQNNTAEGVRKLLEVDQDIIPVAKKALLSKEYDHLIYSMLDCINSGKTVCFSSCGASGRLAIILESMWRSFCIKSTEEFPEHRTFFNRLENQVYSMMTGGDRALIRSVENFEDYQVFGRRQFIDSGLGAGDFMIALTEGGEISSVIGSMKEALERKAGVCMVYNNPDEILKSKFDRSREMLTNPAIIKLNITSGPMALSGSTRMQATTVAMLVVGAAIDECFNSILQKSGLISVSENSKNSSKSIRHSYPQFFSDLLTELNNEASTETLAKLIDIESECYNKSGRLTYVAGQYLLDIFSDTTERGPTFMLPPFRQYDDIKSPVPWAFAKDPLHNSEEAWHNLLKRAPRGLNWTKEDYKKMGAAPDIQNRIHALDFDDIMKFHIGREDDPSRYDCPYSVLMRISCDENQNINFDQWFEENARKYSQSIHLRIGEESPDSQNTETVHLPLNIPESRTSLFSHLAIKLIFNIISTGTMAKTGRIRGNWMIQVDATNKKLIDRATRIIAHFAGISYAEACTELFRTINQPEYDRLQFKKSYVIQTLERLERYESNSGLL